MGLQQELTLMGMGSGGGFRVRFQSKAWNRHRK